MDETPNLDAMEADELRAFASAHEGSPLALYAVTKALAMGFRLQGDTVQALRLESECDAIYAGLPAAQKW